MRRAVFVLLAACSASGLHADLASVPGDWSARGLELAPLEVGRSWTYAIPTGRQVLVVRSATEAASSEGGVVQRIALAVVTELVPNGPAQRKTLQVVVDSEGASYDVAETAERLVRMPALVTADTRWRRAQIERRVVGRATVAAAGQEFRDVVVVETDVAEGSSRLRSFYALGVGMVREERLEAERWVPSRELVAWTGPSATP